MDAQIKWRLFYCIWPTNESDYLQLPELQQTIRELVLGASQPASAAVAFKDHMQAMITCYDHSDLSIENTNTLSVKQYNQAMTNNRRAFNVMGGEPMRQFSKTDLETQESMVHFLTPHTNALHELSGSDNAAASTALAHLLDDKAQLEASTKSKLYCGGRMTTVRDVLTAGVNVRCNDLGMVVTGGSPKPFIVLKIEEILNLFLKGPGRDFVRYHDLNWKVMIHLFQELQAARSDLAGFAKNPELVEAVKANRPIAKATLAPIVKNIDNRIAAMRTIVHGISLAHWEVEPLMAPWFPKPNEVPEGTPGKRQQQNPQGGSPGASPPKKGRLDEATVANRKKQGMLVFDPSKTRARGLPNCPILEQLGDKKSPERLCMKFMTQGYFCTGNPCPLVHHTRLQQFKTPAKRKEFIDFAAKMGAHGCASWSAGLNCGHGPGPFRFGSGRAGLGRR